VGLEKEAFPVTANALLLNVAGAKLVGPATTAKPEAPVTTTPVNEVDIV
jgi:hypothetical protein